MINIRGYSEDKLSFELQLRQRKVQERRTDPNRDGVMWVFLFVALKARCFCTCEGPLAAGAEP